MMINTIYGEMDEADLIKKTGTDEDENAVVNWVEYWLNDELVHRSAHAIMKKDVFGNTVIGDFNG